MISSVTQKYFEMCVKMPSILSSVSELSTVWSATMLFSMKICGICNEGPTVVLCAAGDDSCAMSHARTAIYKYYAKRETNHGLKIFLRT